MLAVRGENIRGRPEIEWRGLRMSSFMYNVFQCRLCTEFVRNDSEKTINRVARDGMVSYSFLNSVLIKAASTASSTHV